MDCGRSTALSLGKRKAAAAKVAQNDATANELDATLEEESKRRARPIDYDWATYDLFPAFRFDFRPVATSMERYVERLSRTRGEDTCTPYRPHGIWAWFFHDVASALRVMPLMNTDIEQTHTIGHLDPPRAPEGTTREHLYFSGRPFGTTRELRGWDGNVSAARKSKPLDDGGQQEKSIDYPDVVTPAAKCPLAINWLFGARRLKIDQSNSGGYATYWDTQLLPLANRPALHFQHGFDLAGLAAITRANDPFWNLRALDNALAEHDGYMLSSYICAMQQLVLDDVTEIPAPYVAPVAAAPVLVAQPPIKRGKH